jgi:hypothetical protein
LCNNWPGPQFSFDKALTNGLSFFEKKEQKALVLLRRILVDSNLVEADLEGWPQETVPQKDLVLSEWCDRFLLFPEKEAKSTSSASQKANVFLPIR